MKVNAVVNLSIVLILITSCAPEKTQVKTGVGNIPQQLKELSESLTEAEKNDDLKSFLAFYTENAISMPEYQPPIMGI